MNKCIFISIVLMIADGFIVRGPSGPLVALLGSSVVLPCYVDELLLMEGLVVEWRRTDSETLVHLYQDGESQAELQQENYRERAHFLTDQIQHGNFSLRLDNLRAEDKGIYRCKVYSQQVVEKILVEIKDVEYLLVSGSSRPISASVGEDVTLNCSVDSHITSEHNKTFSWKKSDKDILVLLYQNNKTSTVSSDERYRDRVELFTDEIPKGNFSLRLKSVRTEDKGVYMCHVFAGGLSANSTAELGQLSLSSLHIMVLVFCFVAGLGAVLLSCCLIYCRSKNTDTTSTIWNLQVGLIFFPNVCMSFAFIFWGLTEGSQLETITCSALYFLRPVMLICALPYLKCLQGNLKTRIRFFKIFWEYIFFTVIVSSVILANCFKWRHDKTREYCIAPEMLFGMIVLCCLILSIDDIRLTCQEQQRKAFPRKRIGQFFPVCTGVLSTLQLVQLIFSFGFHTSPAVFIVALQSLLPISVILLYQKAPLEYLHSRWIMFCPYWIITVTLLQIVPVICVLTIIDKEKQWICVIAFLEVLKITVFFENCVTDFSFNRKRGRLRVQKQQQQTETSKQGSNALHLCHVIMYMFGAVGLVLLNSVTLTTELILKAQNGENFLKDLRVIVFPSECVFALYWLILQMHGFSKIVTARLINIQRNLQQKYQLKKTPNFHEMKNLSAHY